MNEAYQNLMPLMYSTLGSSQGWSPMMSALMSGAATTAIEGDINRGFLSGLMSFGMGKALSGAGRESMGEGWEDATARDRMKAMFGKDGRGAMLGQFSQPGAFLPLVIGAGGMAQMGSNEAWEDQARSRMGNSDQARDQWARAVQRYSANGVPLYAHGGPVRQAQQLSAHGRYGDDNLVHVSNEELQGLASMMPMTRNPDTGLPEAFAWAPIIAAGVSALGGYLSSKENKRAARAASQRSNAVSDVNLPDPVETQRNLGGVNIAPPPGYVPGFNPEFQYFQNLQSGDTPQAPPFMAPWQTAGMYNPHINQAMFAQQPFFQQYLPPFNEWMSDEVEFGNPRLNERYKGNYAGGGLIEEIQEFKKMYRGGEVQSYAGGGPVNGIAALGQADPMNEAVQMLAQALSGAMPQDQADMIVQAFIQQFGQAAFEQAREAILGSGTQNEGIVSGPGGGMDDQVMGTIAQQEPVAVSPGEYIVPADVVSGLGDGSSEAGANELDQLSQRVRVARTGGAVQPPRIDKRVMPA